MVEFLNISKHNFGIRFYLMPLPNMHFMNFLLKRNPLELRKGLCAQKCKPQTPTQIDVQSGFKEYSPTFQTPTAKLGGVCNYETDTQDQRKLEEEKVFDNRSSSMDSIFLISASKDNIRAIHLFMQKSRKGYSWKAHIRVQRGHEDPRGRTADDQRCGRPSTCGVFAVGASQTLKAC